MYSFIYWMVGCRNMYWICMVFSVRNTEFPVFQSSDLCSVVCLRWILSNQFMYSSRNPLLANSRHIFPFLGHGNLLRNLGNAPIALTRLCVWSRQTPQASQSDKREFTFSLGDWSGGGRSSCDVGVGSLARAWTARLEFFTVSRDESCPPSGTAEGNWADNPSRLYLGGADNYRSRKELDLFFSWTELSSCHHAGVSHEDNRKYPGAGGSADLPSGDNARRGRSWRESHPGPDGAGGGRTGGC